MNRIEFNTVVNKADINYPLKKIITESGSNEIIYLLKECGLTFNYDEYGVEICGKIPVAFIDMMIKKYPNYEIKINTGNSDLDDYYVIDQEYDNLIQNIEMNRGFIDDDLEYFEQKNSARDSLNIRKIDINYKKAFCYTRRCIIGTKEGFLAFIFEFRDYIRQDGKLEKETDKYGSLMKEINQSLFKFINPSVPIFELMKNVALYQFLIARDPKTKLVERYRNALSEFINAVNPFFSEFIEFDDCNFQNAIISFHLPIQKNPKCCNFKIKVPGIGYIYYKFSIDSFQFEYSSSNNNFHVFYMYSNEIHKGEYISITDYIDGKFQEVWYFNSLSKDNSQQLDFNNFEQIEYLCKELEKATILARNVTNEIIEKKNKIKSKVSD